MVWGRTPLPFILITGALQRQLEPSQTLMSAHSPSPALSLYIKAHDPSIPGGGKRAAGTLLVPWLLPRAGWTQGRAGDRLHQMGPGREGCREDRTCTAQRESSLAWRTLVALLVANLSRKTTLHTPSPPSSPSVPIQTTVASGRIHGNDAWLSFSLAPSALAPC